MYLMKIIFQITIDLVFVSGLVNDAVPSIKYMDESFQEYSLIQDFEADFPKKVSLKMLN